MPLYDGVQYVQTEEDKRRTMENKPVKEIIAEIRALIDGFCIAADKCEHYDEDMDACCHPPTVGSCKWDMCPYGT